MGGTQRLADRAGPARARELVMTGGLFDAATLERWNVVNRVLPDEGFDAAARAFALRPRRRARRAPTPPRSASSGRRSPAARAPPTSSCPRWRGALFGTEDLRGAVRSFLERGPGHATYEGR